MSFFVGFFFFILIREVFTSYLLFEIWFHDLRIYIVFSELREVFGIHTLKRLNRDHTLLKIPASQALEIIISTAEFKGYWYLLI